MERKVYDGTPPLDLLNRGDSIVRPSVNEWDTIVHGVPQEVAETWIIRFDDPPPNFSLHAAVPGGPIKDWEDGIGIVVEATILFPECEEKIVVLVKKGKEDFRLLRSKNARPINL